MAKDATTKRCPSCDGPTFADEAFLCQHCGEQLGPVLWSGSQLGGKFVIGTLNGLVIPVESMERQGPWLMVCLRQDADRPMPKELIGMQYLQIRLADISWAARLVD